MAGSDTTRIEGGDAPKLLSQRGSHDGELRIGFCALVGFDSADDGLL